MSCSSTFARVLHRSRRVAMLILFSTPHLLSAAVIVVDVSTESAPVRYALQKFGSAVAARGDVAVFQRTPSVPTIRVKESAVGLGVDGFSLAREGETLVVSGANARGAMYGILDVAEQVRFGVPLAAIEPRTVRPALAFRAIKFNLPFAAYRNGPYLEQHQATVKDLKFWEAFLDMMAENRFNTLTLWSLHPFQFMVVPKSFPEAQGMSGAELAEFRSLWNGVFRMAKERGIETFVVNWNTFVSPAFADAHHVARYSKSGAHIGVGATEKIVEDYTRECVTQTIDEYPDLTGLGVTLGERMGGQTPEQRREWLERTFYAGIAAAKRPIKFIYRAPLSATTGAGGSTSPENDRATRKQVEKPRKNILGPTYLDFKYNASHAHSSPDLFLVHGGRLSDAYWNPVPAAYKVLWTMRNEDFIVLRWGQPDFIRQFLAKNRADYIAGAMIGSETYIPALDYISLEVAGGPRRYAYERQWLFYALWGRLLYEPGLPDDRFVDMFDARYGKGIGRDLFEAWTKASDMPLRFASFFRGTWDGSLYTEGFSTWADFGARRLIDINTLINHPVLDSKRYVSIADYVKAGRKTAPGILSPLELANQIGAECAEAEKHVVRIRKMGTTGRPLEEELTDIDAWCAFGNYFAEKLRAGVALATARLNCDPVEQQRAVAHLTLAIGHWENLARLAAKYHRLPVLGPTKEPFSWEGLLPEVKRDVELAAAPIVATAAEKNWRPLLDERLSAWESWMGSPHESVRGLPPGTPSSANARGGKPMGLGNDPKRVFTVELQNGEPILHVSGEIWGGLTTRESFANYHLRLEVKWGDKKWEPRLNLPRNSGLLYHCTGPHGAFWNTWKRSLEFEIQEHDMGDLYPLGGARGDVVLTRASIPWTANPAAGELTTVGAGVTVKGGNRAAHVAGEFENPTGDWNVLELYTIGQTAVHVVNGHVVNVVRHTSILKSDGAEAVPLIGGQLQLQSESAEVYFRRIEIRPITKFPATIERAISR